MNQGIHPDLHRNPGSGCRSASQDDFEVFFHFFACPDGFLQDFVKPVIGSFQGHFLGDKIDFDTEEMKKFIDDIYERVDSVEFKNIVLKNRFWKN